MYSKIKTIYILIKNSINFKELLNLAIRVYTFINIKVLDIVFLTITAFYWGFLCILGRHHSEIKHIFINIAEYISKIYTWIPLMPNTWYIFTYILFLHIVWLVFVTLVNYRVYDAKTITYEVLIARESKLFKLFYLTVVISFFFLLNVTGLGHKIYCKIALNFGFFFFKVIKNIFFFDKTAGFIFVILIMIFMPVAGLYSLELSNKVKEEYIVEIMRFYCVVIPVTITVFLNTHFFHVFIHETTYIYLYSTFIYLYTCGFNTIVARLVRSYQIKIFDNFFLVGTLNFCTASTIIANLYYISLF